ncbi:MAG: DUF1932 domain-containing protein [Paracoccus sp. (in: a-proteobacteria)]|uniref:NAD(P)-dependent oxidoreductase n=1 Tax=Paracoccus sp. TaxID=267 RepID=UPI0026E06114|nr:NAD(P)-dependent oxidoreductase [Paracoccus sp. (in: a-proteobacteria)]MDO5613877.1 DUF1932 domain-containing protein [Paracoccus sp. (in: a-proteobacteria)]
MAQADIAFIGFGEAAEAFATGWGQAAGQVRAYDLKCDDPAAVALPRMRAGRCDVALADNRAAALGGAGVVFCLVTADCAERAATEAAPHLAPGALWFDGNSCSPGAKRRAAAVIEGAGGRYVDLAIMAPVHPKLHRTPLLIAGPHTAQAGAALDALDMPYGVAGGQVGDASSIKMIRSVMIKGMEALSAECLLAARRAGVDGAVLASLQASNPDIDWPRQAAYNLERMMVHGRRRAAEMREVAATLTELGLPDAMARATVDWQQRIGDMKMSAGEDSFATRADMVLGAFGGMGKPEAG